MNVPIELFFIGRTQVDRKEVERWLSFLGVEGFTIPDDEAVSNPALLIALAAKRCYKSFEVGLNPNVTRIRKDWGEYLDNVLASGHGSVLEHSVYNIAIENVSRVFTGEMNRHRAGWAISEGSMRFIRFSEDVPYWEPESIRGPDVLNEDTERMTKTHGYTFELLRWAQGEIKVITRYGLDQLDSIDKKKHATRLLFQRAFTGQKELYKVLEAVWKDELSPESKFKDKKAITSMMRRVIGMGVATGGVWSGNIRALRHVLTMRCDPAAEEEILHVFSRVAVKIKEMEPLLFGDFTQVNGFWVPQYRKV